MATLTTFAGTKEHPVVSQAEWFAARKALLVKEKEFSRLREQLSQQRRDLPWEKVEKEYVFHGPKGKETLAQLFGTKSQLVVYHFMFAPESDQGCAHCSFWADHYDGIGIHLNHRDVNFIVISRAPLGKIEPFKRRMGWNFKWVSSGENDFNRDYHVSFTPEEHKSGKAVYNYAPFEADMRDREGISVFFKDEKGDIYHTYSCYARGIDMVNATYQFLDLVPKGRNEAPGRAQDWVRYHDRYKE